MKHLNGFQTAQRQRGSVTVLSMLLLLILTILGLGVLTSTVDNLHTTQNNQIYRRNLSRAEAAVRQAAQEVTNSSVDDIQDHTPNWLHRLVMPGTGILDEDNWNTFNSGAALDTNSRFLVVHEGVARGTSMSMANLKVHTFTIYGRSDAMAGEVILEVGFKRRM